jgi:hypothetical protein
MCAACALAAASAASGFRTWLQNSRLGWLTPKRLRALTIAAMCAAGIVSTIGFSGSSAPPAHAAPAVHHAASR